MLSHWEDQGKMIWEIHCPIFHRFFHLSSNSVYLAFLRFCAQYWRSSGVAILCSRSLSWNYSWFTHLCFQMPHSLEMEAQLLGDHYPSQLVSLNSFAVGPLSKQYSLIGGVFLLFVSLFGLEAKESSKLAALFCSHIKEWQKWSCYFYRLIKGDALAVWFLEVEIHQYKSKESPQPVTI